MASRPASAHRELGLDPKFTEFARELEARADELADRLLDRALREIPLLTERAELLGEIRRLTHESVRAELGFLRRGAALPDRCPPIDQELARLSARQGGSVGGLVDGYRRGHQVQWEGWFDLVEEREPDAGTRRALLERGWRFFFDYAGRLGVFVAEEFTRERDLLRSGQEHRRMHLVREVLEGASIDPAALDYDLREHHLGLVAWGAGGTDAARGLAERLGRALLLVAVTEDTSWAWLGGTRPLAERERNALARVRPLADARLAIGLEEPGLEGFRRTHRQAIAARRAALGAGGPVTRYEDVALEALAGRDEAAAQEFVDRELRGIDGDDTRSARLRETLEAYFAHAQNAAATAAALGVHEQTVGHRLRAVEERIGGPVGARRAELETAIRLRRYLAQPG